MGRRGGNTPRQRPNVLWDLAEGFASEVRLCISKCSCERVIFQPPLGLHHLSPEMRRGLFLRHATGQDMVATKLSIERNSQ